MKRYTVDEVITMIKPTQHTYTGMSLHDKDIMQQQYAKAKDKLHSGGISTLLNLRLNTVDKETAEMFDYSRKSILINAVIHDGMDGWTDPTPKQEAMK